MQNYFKIDYYLANTPFSKLFHDIQFSGIFTDSKSFPDCTPKKEIDKIISEYVEKSATENFHLKTFVFDNFDLPEIPSNDFITNKKNTIEQHIESLWPVLTIGKLSENSTYLPLPKPIVVPGGRFQELYYWDSYFTCLGLAEHHKFKEIENIVENFSYLIQTFGHVPNGNRSYYLSRSQPPFFTMLVKLLAEKSGQLICQRYLPSMLKEYEFWMFGHQNMPNNTAENRVVKVNNQTLNRYWDNLNTPRPEAYKEDLEMADKATNKAEIFRNIRAAAESGWDFSSRWFADYNSMETIQTTDLLPVDLNCLIYFTEKTIAETLKLNNEIELAIEYTNKANNRKNAIENLFWNETFFYDFNHKTNQHAKIKTLAACFPLYFNIASPLQALQVANTIETDFLKDGGLVTTLNNTNQQWDWPNGWAPLQWIAFQGFKNYGFNELAEKIRINWLNKVETIYKKEGKMTEKYDVANNRNSAGGGEYPNQDGFGWTNGVTLAFLHANKR